MKKLQALMAFAKSYDSKQPRDANGRWSSGGGGKGFGAAKPQGKSAQVAKDRLKAIAKARQTEKPAPAKQPTVPKQPSSPQEYMEHGASLMPPELKRSLDALRDSTGSAALVKARDDANREYAKLQHRAKKLKAEGKRIPADLRAEAVETAELHKRLDEKVEKQIQAHTAAMGKFRESLIASSTSSKKEAADFANSLQIDKSASSAKKALEIRKDAYEYHLLTNGGGSGTIQKITKDSDRAYARPWEKSVNIGANPSKAIIFHEMAHHLESEDPALGDASLKWIQGKAIGGLQKLSKITGNPNYKDSEIAYEDHYLSPYIGKVYMDKSGKPRPLSEVISMGVERMSDPESMTQFYLQDPEHFMFTLGVMRGRKKQ